MDIVKTVAVTPGPYDKVPLNIPQFPSEDLTIKSEPDAVAVNVAHVPLIYHVPALMIQPLVKPPVLMSRQPVSESIPPVGAVK